MSSSHFRSVVMLFKISIALICLGGLGAMAILAQQTPDPAKPAPPAGQTPAAQTPAPTPTPTQTPQTSNPANGKEIDPKDTVIVNTDLVTLTVTVQDQFGRFVSGLNKSAFDIVDNNEKQEITYFSDDDAPVSVGVVFDVSGSMSGDKINRAREALRKFVQTSHNDDQYFLIGFNSRAQLLVDNTRDGDEVLNKLTFVQPKDQTALYDATYLGVQKVTRGAHKKRAILLISDGQDNQSRYTFNEVRRLLKESDVVVYAIGILDGADAGSSLGMEGQAYLDELANISGGKAFFPNTGAEMDEIFERIALELRHQYSIGYRPTNFVNNGKWRKLKVKVTPPRGMPRLFVRTREGYFAITNPR
jgi:Ca-activated chloride channel family protein